MHVKSTNNKHIAPIYLNMIVYKDLQNNRFPNNDISIMLNDLFLLTSISQDICKSMTLLTINRTFQKLLKQNIFYHKKTKTCDRYSHIRISNKTDHYTCQHWLIYIILKSYSWLLPILYKTGEGARTTIIYGGYYIIHI